MDGSSRAMVPLIRGMDALEEGGNGSFCGTAALICGEEEAR
jgi:hypothetical protein